MVFQLQFAFFETAQLQLIVMAVEHQQIDHRVEIAVLHVELDETALDFLNIWHSL